MKHLKDSREESNQSCRSKRYDTTGEPELPLPEAVKDNGVEYFQIVGNLTSTFEKL